MTNYRSLLGLSMVFLLSSCVNTFERLNRLGKAPDLTEMEVPINDDFEDSNDLDQHKYNQNLRARSTNSLWQPGGTTFFRDMRAWRKGDIVKILVHIQDNAKLDNSSEHSRNGNEAMGLTNLFGREDKVATSLSKTGKADSLLKYNGTRNHKGAGNISRKEDVNTEIAAMVTRVLPNGNLVLQGKQEIRVNYELREIKISGIARAKDISINNSIKSDQIAEARISYGGRGQVSDVQQPRTGHQLIDILSPF